MRLRADPSIALPEPFLQWVLLGGGLAALIAARVFPFGDLPSLCGFKFITGLPCLACGMTRSWVHLAHGRLADSLGMSPLGTVLASLTVVGLIYGVARKAGLPAVRLEMSSRTSFVLRMGVILVVLLNWGYVLSAGRA
jgi:hypothetical protein